MTAGAATEDWGRDADRLRELVAAVRRFAERGWTPATSSNFSLRLTDGAIAMTASGLDKGDLREADFLRLDAKGEPRAGQPQKPSAETMLHVGIYQTFSDAGCVLHTHSLEACALSMRADTGDRVRWEGLELLKAFPGVRTHAVERFVPVVDNSQEMDSIWRAVAPELREPNCLPAFVIRGHGVYAWGDSVFAARRHLEALEFLLAYKDRSR